MKRNSGFAPPCTGPATMDNTRSAAFILPASPRKGPDRATPRVDTTPGASRTPPPLGRATARWCGRSKENLMFVRSAAWEARTMLSYGSFQPSPESADSVEQRTTIGMTGTWRSGSQAFRNTALLRHSSGPGGRRVASGCHARLHRPSPGSHMPAPTLQSVLPLCTMMLSADRSRSFRPPSTETPGPP